MTPSAIRTVIAADEAPRIADARALLREAGLHCVAEVSTADDLGRSLQSAEVALCVLLCGAQTPVTLEGWVRVLAENDSLPAVLLLEGEADIGLLPAAALADCVVMRRPPTAAALAFEVAAVLCQRFLRSPDHPGVRAAVHALPHAVLRTDFEGRVLSANQAFTGLLDYPALASRTLNLLTITAPGQRDLEQSRQARRRAGEVTRYESILLAHDGSLRPVTVSAWPGATRDPQPADVLLVIPRKPHRALREALLRDQELAPRIVSRLGQGISVTNAQRQFEFVNEAMAAMLGRKPEELVGRLASDFVVEEDQAGQGVQNALRRAGHSTNYEVHLKRADGTRLLVSVNAVPRWKDGQFAGAIAVVTDLSEQRKTEAALQESEARFRTLIESSQDGIVVHRDGVILYVNPACQVLFRADDSFQVLGRNILEFVHPDMRAATLERMKLIAREAATFPRWEFRALRLDGTEADMESEGIPIIFDGHPALYSTVRDISERKRSERALAESEERYRALVEMSPEPVAVHRQGKLVFVNSAFVALVRAANAAEAMQKGLLDYVHPDDRPVAQRRMSEIASGQKEVPLVEMRGVRLDGEEMYVETKGTAIEFEGAPAVFVAVRDLTERRRMEETRALLEAELREAQKMQALGTLAGGIAHDFNNILAIIRGNLILAVEDAAGNGQLLESLQEIDAATGRAANLVRQILSFSRRQPTQRVPLDLGPVVESTCRMLRTTIPARIHIMCRVDRDVPRVLADRTQMEQVILNLCANAAQAMASRGVIEIDLQRAQLDDERAASHHALAALRRRHAGPVVLLRVRDNGPGMAPEVLVRAFEPFFTTKDVDKGTGLGLSVVHGIIESHQGAIVAESEPGQGALFSIYLPALALGLPGMGETSGPDRSSDGVQGLQIQGEVIYIDDDPSLLHVVERQMARMGCRLRIFSRADEALAFLAQSHPVSLVITDYNMPGRSGLEVAREIRRLRPDILLALASGFIDEHLRKQAEEAGLEELILKSGTGEEFCDAVVRILKRRPAAV